MISAYVFWWSTHVFMTLTCDYTICYQKDVEITRHEEACWKANKYSNSSNYQCYSATEPIDHHTSKGTCNLKCINSTIMSNRFLLIVPNNCVTCDNINRILVIYKFYQHSIIATSYIDNIHTFSANIKFIFTSFRNR